MTLKQVEETSHLDALRRIGVPEDVQARFADDPAAWDRLLDNVAKEMASDPEIKKALDQSLPAEQQSFSVVPQSAFVVKTTLLKSTNTYPSGFKLFINITHSPYIPAPPLASDEEIRKSINGENKGDEGWKVPMSLAGPRDDVDKVGRACVVFDACINSDVLDKVQKEVDFKLFIIELSIEWVEEKHRMSLSRDFILPKMRSKGELQEHKIYRPKRAGISQHLDTSSNKSSTKTVNRPIIAVKSNPEHTIFSEDNDSIISVTIQLPQLASIKNSTLDIEARRLVFEADMYSLTVKLPRSVDIDHVKTDAEFNRETHVLSVTLFAEQ